MWFNSYLHSRKQYISINGHNSSPSIIQTRVQKVPDVGPLLLQIYINDFYRSLTILNFILQMIQMMQQRNSQCELSFAHQELEKNSHWAVANSLALNTGKTSHNI